MKAKKLQDELRSVVMEYTRQTAQLLERDVRDCHWVGTNDANEGVYTICDLGDITFLTLDQMQVIIDQLPDWEHRYGSREAVAKVINEWLEWSIEDCNIENGHAHINLKHWLMGLRSGKGGGE